MVNYCWLQEALVSEENSRKTATMSVEYKHNKLLFMRKHSTFAFSLDIKKKQGERPAQQEVDDFGITRLLAVSQ